MNLPGNTSGHSIEDSIAIWTRSSNEFDEFYNSNRKAIHKELHLHSGERLTDFECELAVAFFLLRTGLVSLELHPGIDGFPKVPDYLVQLGVSTRFFLEVKRIRGHNHNYEFDIHVSGDEIALFDIEDGDERFAAAVRKKLAQCVPGHSNVLFFVTDSIEHESSDLRIAFESLMNENLGMPHLSAIILYNNWPDAFNSRRHTFVLENPSSTYPLPSSVIDLFKLLGPR